jgi:hypothetical protein
MNGEDGQEAVLSQRVSQDLSLESIYDPSVIEENSVLIVQCLQERLVKPTRDGRGTHRIPVSCKN